MTVNIVFTEDPAEVLTRAGSFLVSEPVHHNLLLTLLHARVRSKEAGRYWMAFEGDKAAGVVLQSPTTYPAVLSPMKTQVIAPLVETIAAKVTLAGINGEAATAAAFAGQWTERCKAAAMPVLGMRLYELQVLGGAPKTEGTLRQAVQPDRQLMIEWSRAFADEVHEPSDDMEARVDMQLAAGQLWLWENGETVSIALAREGVERVVRISGVYTPPEKRKRGWAEACVHALSKRLRDTGYRCILYTDLANPTSNSIYRRIGYRAVAEVLRYRFD